MTHNCNTGKVLGVTQSFFWLKNSKNVTESTYSFRSNSLGFKYFQKPNQIPEFWLHSIFLEFQKNENTFHKTGLVQFDGNRPKLSFLWPHRPGINHYLILKVNTNRPLEAGVMVSNQKYTAKRKAWSHYFHIYFS